KSQSPTAPTPTHTPVVLTMREKEADRDQRAGCNLIKFRPKRPDLPEGENPSMSEPSPSKLPRRTGAVNHPVTLGLRFSGQSSWFRPKGITTQSGHSTSAFGPRPVRDWL